ncbi:hypothetical protein [Nocardia phage KYD2]|nr:hypothetical protein [Nocardia phage KYD2]
MSVYTLCMASHRYTPTPVHRLPVSRTAQALLAFTALVIVAAAIQYWYVTLPVAAVVAIVLTYRKDRARARDWEARMAKLADVQHQAYMEGHPYGTHGGYPPVAGEWQTADDWGHAHGRRA